MPARRRRVRQPGQGAGRRVRRRRPADRRRRCAGRRGRPGDLRRAAAVRRRHRRSRCRCPTASAAPARCCAARARRRDASTTSSATGVDEAATVARPRLLVVGDDGSADDIAARRALRRADPARRGGGPPRRRGAARPRRASSGCARPASTCRPATRWPDSPRRPRSASSPPPTWRSASASTPARAARPSGITDAVRHRRPDRERVGRHQGDPRGARREPRHRGDQVRRVRDHRLVVDARRGRALGRRLGQPGAAAARRALGAPARPTAEHPFGYGRDRYVYGFLVALHAVLRRRPVRAVRGRREDPPPAPPRHARSSRSSCCWSPSGSSRSRCAPPSRESRGTQGRPTPGSASSGTPRTRSCRSCCSRTSRRSSGLLLALVGVGLADADRRRRCGTASAPCAHRRAADHRRGRARHRDEEPAARRVGGAGGRARASRPRWSARGVERVIHLRTMHLGPDELLVGAKLAMPAAATLRRGRGGHRRRRGAGAGGRADARGSSTWNPTSIAGVRP